MGVPGLGVVLGDVGRGFVALAGVDEAVVEGPAAVGRTEGYRAAVQGDVGHLPTVPFGCRVGQVAGPLEGVVDSGGNVHRSEPEVALGRRVHSEYLHVAEVHHRPAELVGGGHGYDLVVYLVEIHVGLYVHSAEPAAAAYQVPGGPEVVLDGLLRLQPGCSGEGVVEVVEGGHAVVLLVECPQLQVNIPERLP